MGMTDPIADALTRIRNALMAGKKEVCFKANNMLKEIVRILKEEGFIEDYRVEKKNAWEEITVTLRYFNGESVIRSIRRISKPGRRVYVNKQNLPKVKGGLGIAIISTSYGVMTDKEARKKGVGGEYICEVW